MIKDRIFNQVLVLYFSLRTMVLLNASFCHGLTDNLKRICSQTNLNMGNIKEDLNRPTNKLKMANATSASSASSAFNFAAYSGSVVQNLFKFIVTKTSLQWSINKACSPSVYIQNKMLCFSQHFLVFSFWTLTSCLHQLKLKWCACNPPPPCLM